MKFVPAEMGMLYTQMRYEICVQGELLQRSTVKGIVQMISDNRAKKFIMGAAAYKHYSTKMEKLRSRKAILVSQYASAACHIHFICKGHPIHTSVGKLRMDEVRALSTLLYAHTAACVLSK
ncbi:U-box domain-containing protein 37-like [Brassica rapa]|uniref:U-box domain-containing protein 37-like n=1 Tax=Brassica campestris TaxID=3711 RepID=UPI00142E8CDD|nr:U-box domain-containing protein 37-like [Brassica rapa]